MLKKNFLVIICFICFLILFFYKYIFFNQVLFYGDVYWYFVPVRKLISESFKNFFLPHWINSLDCGFPIFSAAQYGVLNILQMPFYFLKDQANAYTLIVLISILILYFSSYIYFKYKFKNKVVSIFCSLLYTFFGFNISNHLFVPIIVSSAVLPLAFYFLERYIKSSRKIFLIYITLIISFQIFNGHPQLPFLTVTGLVIHSIITNLIIKKYRIIFHIKIIIIIFVVTIFAICLSAVQVMPLYQLSKFSTRENLDLSGSISLNPLSLISFALYNFWGSEADNSFIGPPMGWGSDLFLGILSIFFFYIGLRNIKYNFQIKYIVGLFLLFLLLALGRFSPIYFIIKNIFIFKKFRGIIRFVLLVNFYEIMICGWGLIIFLQKYKRKKLRIDMNFLKIFFIVIISAILLSGIIIKIYKNRILNFSRFAIESFASGTAPDILKSMEKGIRKYPASYYYGKLDRYLNSLSEHFIFEMLILILFFSAVLIFYKKRIPIKYLLILIFIFYAIDAKVFYRNISQFIDKKFYVQLPSSVETLLKKVNEDKSSSHYYRFFCLNRGIMLMPFKYYEGYAHNLEPFYHLKNYLYRNDGLNYGLDLFYGEDTLEYRRLYLMKTLIRNGYFNLLKFSSTKYIFSDSELDEKKFEFIENNNHCFFYIYRNPLPHYYFVNNFIVLKNDDIILNKLNDENIDYNNFIIIEEEQNLPVVVNSKPNAEITLKIYNNSKKIFSVKTDCPGFFVLTDSFYPCWECSVNNQKKKIFLANYMFQSVYLPAAGNYEIELKYNDRYFVYGFYTSIICLFVLLILWLIIGLSDRQKSLSV